MEVEMVSAKVIQIIQAQNTLMITKTTKQKEFTHMQKVWKQQQQVRVRTPKVIRHQYTQPMLMLKEEKLGLWVHKHMSKEFTLLG